MNRSGESKLRVKVNQNEKTNGKFEVGKEQVERLESFIRD